MPARKRKRDRGKGARADQRFRKPKAGRTTRRKTGEAPAADALTIGWLLALLFLLACELGTLSAWWFRAAGLGAQLAAEYLLMASLVLAVFSLGLLTAALRIRRTPPPGPLVITTWALSLLPWGVYLVLWLRH